MTISAAHAERLRALHDRDPNFGAIAYLWAPRINTWLSEAEHDGPADTCASLLDYGCGKATLVPALKLLGVKIAMHEYDPATQPGVPSPADFVACIDVLEHVEQDSVDDVLADLNRLTLKFGLVTVSLRDGSLKNKAAHPNIHPREWWMEKFEQTFSTVQEVVIINPEKAKSEVAVVVRPRK